MGEVCPLRRDLAVRSDGEPAAGTERIAWRDFRATPFLRAPALADIFGARRLVGNSGSLSPYSNWTSTLDIVRGGLCANYGTFQLGCQVVQMPSLDECLRRWETCVRARRRHSPRRAIAPRRL